LRQLTANSSENRVTGGAISPDGKYLAYVALKGMHIKLINTGEIQTVPLPELDQIRNLEWDISPSGWFPDSTRFLATAHEAANLNTGDWTSEGSSIWMVSVLGGAPHKLRDNAVAFSVSPDGSLVSFGTNKGRLGDREIWLMGTNGERAQKSIETDENSWIVGTNWSADGRRVIYARIDDSGVGLFSRDLKGGLLTTVIPPSEGINVTHAVWSPDGRLIYSVREPGSIRDTCNYWAMRLDARTGEPLEKPRRLTTVARPCMWTESVTADGRRLAFLEMLNHATVYVADLQVGGTRILNSRHFTLDESFAFQEDWTIDGKAILFISNRAGQYGIYKQSLDQETPDLIAAGAGDFGNVRASPDGKWIIAFLYPKRGGPSGSEQLMRIPISGGGPELMFSARLRSQMSCAKPPSTLCVVAEPAEDRKQLIVTSFDAIKGRGLKLTRFDLDPKEDRWSCEISADGTRIAATRSPAGPIYILSLEEQTERAIPAKELKNIQVFRWAADGKGLFVGEEASGGSLLLYVDMNGNSHVLSENHAGNRAIGVPSPDGRQLATLGWSMDGNMWLMENF
jgi:Tol biopolymer transport system component